jgi:hypothetical protein
MKIIYSNEDVMNGGCKMSGGARMRGEEKTTYLAQCNQLLTANDVESRDFLLAALEADARRAIDKLYPDYAEQLHGDVTKIFASIQDISPDMINNLFIYNIVCLQVAVVFTYACIDFVPVRPETVDYYDLNGQGNWFNEFTNVKDTDFGYAGRPGADWREWNNVIKKQKCDYYKKDFIITILDYLTIDEIVLPYLDNKYLCGITYEKTYADSRLFVPFFFIDHDRFHGNDYDYICFDRVEQDRSEMKRFYALISSISDPDKKLAAKIMYFIQMHEDFCDIFNLSGLTAASIKNPNSRFYSGRLEQERFMNDNDLGKIIPKPHRITPETRIEYLVYAAEVYFDMIKEFRPVLAGKRKKRKSRKTKKNKKRSRRSRK